MLVVLLTSTIALLPSLPSRAVVRDASPPHALAMASRRAVLTGGTAAAAAALFSPAAATAASIVSMAGKTVVVTGANSGLGLATATQLADAGATVVLAVRDAAKGQAAINDIRATTQAGKLEAAVLDLGDLSSVRSSAKSFGADRPVDVLMLNAGVMAIPTRSLTADGFERHLGVNHLGHFALTALLWPNLRKAATASSGARVVVVSSDGHKKSNGIAFDDLNLEKPGAYKDCSTPFCSAYTQSKLANVLFAAELERRIPKDLDVAVSSLSPGLVNTALFRYSLPDLKADASTGSVDDPDGKKLETLKQVQGYFMTPADKAAQTQLSLASDPSLTRTSAGGRYFVDGKSATPSKTASDPEVASKLWSVSEELTGIAFNPAA